MGIFWVSSHLRRAMASVLIGLSMTAQLAVAFDIPTPQNQPQTINTTPFGTPQDFGPVTPLAPTSEIDSTAGAGHLPAGVSVRTQITEPPHGFLQRAPFLVTLTITDRDKSIASLTLHRPHGAHIATRRIDINQQLVSVDGRSAIVRVYRFAVTPLSAGAITLDFAEMTFREVGDAASRYAYIPVARILDVRPLPAFWPTYLPVTPALRITEEPLPKLAAGQPVNWVLHISGDDLSTYALLKMLNAQLVGTAALGVGRARIPRPPEAARASTDVLGQTFEVHITLLPDPEGQGVTQGVLPALRLPYIDSRRADPGKALSEAILPARTVHWSAPAGQRFGQALAFWWWRVLLLLVLIYLLGIALRDVWQRVQRRRRYRRAQAELAMVHEPQAVMLRLRQLTGESSIQSMIRRAPNPRFIAALHRLEAACYRQRDARLEDGYDDALGDELVAWEYTHQELVRWLPRAFFTS